MLEFPLTSILQQSSAASPTDARKPALDDAPDNSSVLFKAAYDEAGHENDPENQVATNGEPLDKDAAAAEPEAEILTGTKETDALEEEILVVGTDAMPATTTDRPEFAVSDAPQKLSETGTKGDADDARSKQPADQLPVPVRVKRKEDFRHFPETSDRPARETDSRPVQAGTSTAEHLVLSKAVSKEPGASLQVTPQGGVGNLHQDDISEVPRGVQPPGRKPELLGQNELEPMPTISHKKPFGVERQVKSSRFVEKTVVPEQVAPAPKLKTDASSLVIKKVFQITRVEGADGKVPPILMESGDPDGVIHLEQRAPGQIALTNIGQVPGRAETPAMIARQMAEAFQNLPDRPVEISLNPRELGRIRMNILTVDAGITVNVVAERPETLDLLRRNIEQLVREFETMGYNDINFAFAEGQTRESFENESNERDEQALTKLNLETVETTEVPKEKAVGSSGVDIRL